MIGKDMRVLGQTFDHMLGMPEVAGDAFRLAVHGVGAWLGFKVGRGETGLLSGTAYVFGALNGIAAYLDAVSVLDQVLDAIF